METHIKESFFADEFRGSYSWRRNQNRLHLCQIYEAPTVCVLIRLIISQLERASHFKNANNTMT